MPIADPVLLHILNSQGIPVAVRAPALAGQIEVVIADRNDAVQEWAEGVVSSLGDNTALGAPGSGNQFVVCRLQIQNESSTETTVIVKWGSRAVWRAVLAAKGSGVILDLNAPDRMEGRDNQPLILNLSGANAIGYSVQYYVVAV